ncbi:MAG: hypothetical protein J1D88_00590 [Treponema sp.]|nr:hypothetical protein [Treponema sp.]
MKNLVTEFSLESLFAELPQFYARGVTELTVHDKTLAADKKAVCALLERIACTAPDLFVSIAVDVSCIDPQVVEKAAQVWCSIEIPLTALERNGTLLFDKKRYASKAALLNRAGIVFGFDMDWALLPGDTFRAFRERLDFATTLYPNHIDFEQIERDIVPRSTGVYSSKDIDFSRGMAFACVTFYSCGRAVPWFNAVLRPLKISPSSFFADFEEWQHCNNCSYETGFVPQNADHHDIEKMQLLFLKEKYEEKNKGHLFAAVHDIVTLHGAFSRVADGGTETVLETAYNPDDVLSPAAQDIARFCDNTCEEPCTVTVFLKNDNVDYKIH